MNHYEYKLTVVNTLEGKRFSYWWGDKYTSLDDWWYAAADGYIYIYPKDYDVGDTLYFVGTTTIKHWDYLEIKVVPEKLFPDVDYGDDT